MNEEALIWAARIVMGGAFLTIGIRNIRNHAMIAGLLRSRGIPLPALSAAAGIAMQGGFGAMLMTGLCPVVAVSGLAVFVVSATVVAHLPVGSTDAQRQENITACLINTTMLGGLLALAAAGIR